MNEDLYEGLRQLVESSFPKRCNSCGRVFESSTDFIESTSGVPTSSGIKAISEDSGKTVLELFRNCPCGSTLMDYFMDRRDITAKGLRRRRAFDRMVSILQHYGISKDLARKEILKFMNGRETRVLNQLGLRKAAPERD